MLDVLSETFSNYLSFLLVWKDDIEMEKKEGAVVFLSEVWRQLGSLYFERKGDCFEPLTDMELENKTKIASQTYRAVGRLIAFSLFHGIPVPRGILSMPFWVHLFRAKDYLETDKCFQNFALISRADNESNTKALCETFGVAEIGDNEDYETFLGRIYPYVLEFAKTYEHSYSSDRQLGWDSLKEGFEYSYEFFDSKQKYHHGLQQQLYLCLREHLASVPWTAATSILSVECIEEECMGDDYV